MKHSKQALNKAMVTIGGKKGMKPIRFKKGGLHESLGVPMGEKIPQAKLNAAAAGEYGSLAVKQARFARSLKKMRSS